MHVKEMGWTKMCWYMSVNCKILELNRTRDEIGQARTHTQKGI